MNFFEYQEAARRKTRWLIFYYVLAVALITLTLCLITSLIFHYQQLSQPGTTPDLTALWDPALFGIVALATGLLILFGSLYKIVTLAAGGEAVATMLDGRPIAPNTSQIQEKRLLNVVEEMAIASGTPIPRVFVLDHEPGINAFAAGFSPKDAIIGVTRGALDTLTRDELQGVIGHEFSHILNGDMRLNIRLIGVLNGILVIAITGYWLVRIIGQTGGRSRDRKGNPLAALVLLGLAMIVIGYIGVFFARLIKSAVSRQREYLADASSVQFTRNPAGLADALKKIGGLLTGSRVQAHSAEAASHLFFANGVGSSFLGLLATHPPLEERISRLDSYFSKDTAGDGGYYNKTNDSSALVSEAEAPVVTGVSPVPIDEGIIQSLSAVSPAQVVMKTGTLSALSLTRASQVLDRLPPPLMTAARTPAQAQIVIVSLLLDRAPAMRQQQLDYLAAHAPADLNPATASWADLVDALPREDRAALAGLATATLRQLSPERYTTFRVAVMDLMAADSQISLFEYMIMRMMIRNLDPQFGMGQRPRPHLASLTPLAAEVATVMSALCWFGTDKPDEANRAFAAGRKQLRELDIQLLSPDQSSLDLMDTALDKLAGVIPALKQRLIAAFTAAITTDGIITTDEGEALRAIADALDCPIPPFL